MPPARKLAGPPDPWHMSQTATRKSQKWLSDSVKGVETQDTSGGAGHTECGSRGGRSRGNKFPRQAPEKRKVKASWPKALPKLCLDLASSFLASQCTSIALHTFWGTLFCTHVALNELLFPESRRNFERVSVQGQTPQTRLAFATPP